MKTLGIVRRIDDLGRVVIPKEVRSAAGIREGDPLEISMVQVEGKWCPLFSPYNEKNPGIDLGKVEGEQDTRKVTLRDSGNDRTFFLIVSESAYNLLNWLCNEEALNYDWELTDGHNIDTETFV